MRRKTKVNQRLSGYRYRRPSLAAIPDISPDLGLPDYDDWTVGTLELKSEASQA